MKILKTLCLCIGGITLFSCSSQKLITQSVAYQSVRTRNAQPTTTNPIPDDAKIAIAYTISKTGNLTAIVYNRTSEIMTIDQTMSFFVNSNGQSMSYYDPTVRTTSTTDMSSATKGASVNLGAIAGAFGIGGAIGQIANGVNVGGSGTSGTAVTNTTYIADQPKVSIAPHGNGAMSKAFKITGIGMESLSGSMIEPSIPEKQSYCTFSVCISYSTDGGNTFNKIITNFYANSKIIIPVSQHGRVNEALRQLWGTKTDAINEPWWILHFNNNIQNKQNAYNTEVKGILYDYQ